MTEVQITGMTDGNLKLHVNMGSEEMRIFLIHTAMSLMDICSHLLFGVKTIPTHPKDRAIELKTCECTDNRYTAYIDLYCSGTDVSVLDAIMLQNATVLYQFIEGCVKQIVPQKSLSMLDRGGYYMSEYELIIDALDAYTEYRHRQAKYQDKPFTDEMDFTKYNDYFRRHMSISDD